MNRIVAIKDNKYLTGSAVAVGEVIGTTSQNISKHIANGKEILEINGYIVYLEGDNLKRSNK